MAENKLAKVERQIVALADMTSMDLQSKDKVDGLIAAAAVVQEQKKDFDAKDKEIKDQFKRLCKPQIDAGQNVTCYSWDNEKKMTITMRGGGAEIDDALILDKLYEVYGEEKGDRTGKAWEAFCAISDEVEIPRVLNPDKLAAELNRAERIKQGLEEGTPFVTQDIVQEATVFTAPTPAASLSSITKAEKEMHTKDGYAPVFVASER